MGIRCRGCVDVMWGRHTLLSCLKTNDLLTWLSPDDTFPRPPHQHQYLGRLYYQNRPSLSLLGYKVKKTCFCPINVTFLISTFFPTRCPFICILLLTYFSPYQTYFTPEGPALTKAGGGPFAFCACKYQIVVVWLCCYISLLIWNDIVALLEYICLRQDLVLRAF